MIAISSTFTADPLLDPLRYWIKELEFSVEVELAPYSQVFQQLLDPASLLAQNQRGLNVILIRLEDWERGSQASAAADSTVPGDQLGRTAAELVAALKAASARGSAPCLVCFCPPSTGAAADGQRAGRLAETESRLAAELAGLAGVYLLGAAELAAWYPVPDYYDASADELGHVPYTPVFFTALATAVARKFHALKRPAYKVLVLDCDQTLWSGVCGEDGPQGIRLDPPRQALQTFAREQQAAGMLLCLCSKNNEEDVREVFAQRLDMPLRQEHFAAWRLNWQPKSENLKSLARELQLGLDSFIFVDDNPVECAEVEANCPEVLTLQLPENPELIPQFFKHCWVFDRLKLTAEDRQRGEMYQQNRQREQLLAQSTSLADFIAGLRIKIQIEPLRPEQITRLAQLTQRTNQFNFTTRRRAEADLQKLPASTEVLVVHVSDRFGDYGLVGALIFEAKKAALEVDTFLLSCRVLGRGVEHRMLARLGELARERRLNWLDVPFIKSARNKPAVDFLESVGGGFKQPWKQDWLFRFPAAFAAEIAFSPPAVAGGPASAAHPAARQGQEQTAAGQTHKFVHCRRIALEANDAAEIHRRAEAKTGVRTGTGEGYVAPQTDMERKLCELWQGLLHVERVGIQDNFFELGGHSLLAVRLFAQIEKIAGRKFPLVTLFQAPTVEQLARVLCRETPATRVRSLLVPIQPQGSKPPLFLVHGAGGDVLWGYANLAAHLDPEQPVYGIKSRGQAGLEEFTNLEEMASCYVAEMLGLQPHGPYYVGGYCFGGNVAYEMARQLHARGESVALVALLDSAPSNAGYEKVTWWHPGFAFRFIRNFGYWFTDFRRLDPQDRRRFVVRKTRVLGRKLTRRLRFGRGAAPVDVEEVIE